MRRNLILAFFFCFAITTGFAQSGFDGRWATDRLTGPVPLGERSEIVQLDIIVENGKQLVGETFAERQKRLYARFPKGTYEVDQYRVGPYVSLAMCFKSNYNDLWKGLKTEDEGLVLKDPKARLEACLKPASNARWQVKARRPTKNYSF